MTKGKFLWKKEWYSLCSMHREYQADCPICQHGKWCNVIAIKIDHFVYTHFPKFWKWYKNIAR